MGRVPGVTHLQCCPSGSWGACAVRVLSVCFCPCVYPEAAECVVGKSVWSLWAPWFWVEVFFPPSISSSRPGAQP